MRMPVLWFAIIAVALFAIDSYRTQDSIIVDGLVKKQISDLWVAQMGQEPNQDSLSLLVKRWVREEMFYREAVRLGLSREDTIIRRRLVQKLEFLAQDVDDELVTEADIEAYYEANHKKYLLPTRYSLSQVYFMNKEDLKPAEIMLGNGADWQDLGDPTLLLHSLLEKDQEQIAAILGLDFSGQLGDLVEKKWIGPVSSSFGYHLVRLDELIPATNVPLAEIKNKVLGDLLFDRREASLETFYRGLQDQYTVVYE